ncbi:MAG TPA: TraR/DksA C4-type zinc finger protein [Gaiellaceae bacterium]|jgi:RNA polymerase-binding protein DksA|nr:TraR/DksA C4-type zinc finger protein [Gaiellaceae bacterium]
MNTDRYRDVLLGERERVSAAIQHLHDDNAGSIEDETEEETYDNHLADSATATLNREIDYSLEENSEHMLTAIDEALQRIESGTFGTCKRCGNPIAEERLEAIPYANRCIDCKRLEERG